jgi:hypothetical protein
MISVPESVLERFRAFSLYNSPYRAHDDGSAIDLYPGADAEPAAPSPVAGEVVAIERVRAPPKPYAPDHDYLVALDTGAAETGPEYGTDGGEAPIARILHVDPSEGLGPAVGDRVAVGDPLGDPIRAGFFAPWVDRHLHLGFRRPGDDVRRAAGSLLLSLDLAVEAVSWDGTGTVVETAETYAVLDRPRHPAPGERFATIAGTLGSGVRASDAERAESARTGTDPRPVPIDGGLAHYEYGGVFGRDGYDGDRSRTLSLLGEQIGIATGRTVEWTDPTVTVDGTPVEGLSLAADRDDCGAKLICPGLSLSIGDEVSVATE